MDEYDDRNDESEPMLAHNDRSEVKDEKKYIIGGYILFLLIGLAPQLMQNAIFSESPLFLQETPEKKRISSYIVTSYMVASIFCLFYLLLRNRCKINDTIFIFVILVGCFIDCLMVIFFWDKTTTIDKVGDVSYVLLLCGFVAGALGNTSTMSFFAFASKYKPILTPALSYGYGLSGFVSSVITIIQNPKDYRFSIEAYFYIIACIIFVSTILFFLVVTTKLGQKLQNEHPIENEEFQRETKFKNLIRKAWIPMFNMFWVSILTFFVPGLIPFMVNNVNSIAYLNAIFLILPPLGAALAGFFKFYFISITSSIQTVVFLYLLLPLFTKTHHLLPKPMWLTYLLMVLFSLLSGYNTTMIYLRVRKDFDARGSDSERVSRWVALINQIGAMLGIFINDIIIHSHLYYLDVQ